MHIKSKMGLIKDNVVEIVTEKELEALLKSKKRPVTYCGYEISGPIHLGHMVTTTKLMELGNAGFKVKVLLADLHTKLNIKGSDEFIREQHKKWERGMKALGLKADFILGSSFQFKKEYWDDVMTMATLTSMKRGLRSMQEIARDIENARVSQILYPLMQIEDIKALGVDVAYGGIEQRKIHMLARELLPKVGYKEPVALHTPLITSLLGPGKKMSSSVPKSSIFITDNEKMIREKLNGAHCIAGDVKENPVMDILRLVIFPRIDKFKIERSKKHGGDLVFKEYGEIEATFKNKKVHPLDLKNSVAEEIIKILEPVKRKARFK
ncbi:MAG: tyrosine--tRNA ligase [Candidatus Aenigmatarchaeota archaeon]